MDSGSGNGSGTHDQEHHPAPGNHQHPRNPNGGNVTGADYGMSTYARLSGRRVLTGRERLRQMELNDYGFIVRSDDSRRLAVEYWRRQEARRLAREEHQRREEAYHLAHVQMPTTAALIHPTVEHVSEVDALRLSILHMDRTVATHVAPGNQLQANQTAHQPVSKVPVQ